MFPRHCSPSLLLFVLIFLTGVSLARSQLGASFGEPCGDEIRCNPRALLSCHNSLCECIQPNEMTYDNDRKKCVVISGGRCAYAGEDKLDCVRNSICNGNGYCECSKGNLINKEQYYGNTEGLCIPKGVQGENCTNDEECRRDMLLSCESGICSCKSSKAVFDPVRNKCAVLAGRSCVYGRDTCVSKAYCPRPKDGGHCRCESSDYLKTKSGLCLPSHGIYCDGENPCHEEFACVDGKCSCHFPSHQEYNSSLGQCVSFVRGPCLENVDGESHTFPCVENAECSNSSAGSGGVNECTCSDGWIESTQKLCRPSHGSPCSNKLTGSHIREEYEYKGSKYLYGCDPTGGLVCRNERCSCPELQIYDEDTSRCRGLVGAVCAPGKDNFCIEGAACVKYRDPEVPSGVCRCGETYTTTAERKCVGHGGTF